MFKDMTSVLYGFPMYLPVSWKGTIKHKTFKSYPAILLTFLPFNILYLGFQVYRYRWQIALFFRWFKCFLGCQHLLALSQNGSTIQVSCALIASLLIRLWTGRKPTKRTFEMICLYFQGWASLEELIGHIEGLKSQDQKQQ